MAKKSAKAAKKAAKKSAPKARPPKHQRNDTTGAYTDENTQALFLQHQRKILAQEKKAQVAKDALGKLYEIAKTEGFPKSSFKLAVELSTDEGSLRVQARIEEMQRVARWIAAPLGTQIELFPNRTPSSDQAADEGMRDGLAGNKRKCDYAPDTEQYRRYMAKYDEGQAILARGIKRPDPTPIEKAAEAPTAKPDGSVPKDEFHRQLKEMTSNVPGQESSAPPIGTEAPTHTTSE